MSWSFSAIGKPAAVSALAAKAKESNPCVTPEESFRQTALDLIVAATAAYPEGKCVQVEASGHQDRGNDTQATNNLRLSITPIYGFVE